MDETVWSDDFQKPPETYQEALDYFCQTTNPFYDKTCLNEMAKMDRRSTSQRKFEHLKGIYYEVNGSYSKLPWFYVIEKIEGGKQNQSPLCYYYIIERKVFQSPTLYDIMTVRLNNMIHLLNPILEKPQNVEESQFVYYYPSDFQNSFDLMVKQLENETSREIMKK
jgi:hypothetical protein